MTSWAYLGVSWGILAALGLVLAALGILLGASWEAPGVILEPCRSTFGGPKALGKRSGSDVSKGCKPSKASEDIAKLEVPRSRNL